MTEIDFVLKMWGLRGGYPKPGPTTVRYGGNTTCFELRVAGHRLIVDAGTGIIGLGDEMMEAYESVGAPMRSLLLFTHLHHDHTQGLPFFGPIFHPQNTLHIFGPRPSEHRDLEAVLGSVYESPVSPIGLPLLKSRVFIEQVREGDVIVLNDADAPPQLLPVHEVPEELPRDAVVVRIHHGYHHPRTGIFVYRVEYEGRSVVLATDTEGYVGGDRRLIEFARGADLLVHDAEYDEEEYAAPGKVRQGWGHSTWRMAVEVAQAAGVGQLLLTHHSPRHDDEYLDGMEAKAQAVFPNTRMAYEGLVVEL